MTNPNMNFQKYDMNPMSKNMDIRLVLIVMAIIICAGLTVVGDQAVFGENPPTSTFAVILGWINRFFFDMTADRLAAGITVFIIYSIFIAGGGAALFMWLNIYVIEPMMIERKLQQIKKEKDLINKLDDGTL